MRQLRLRHQLVRSRAQAGLTLKAVCLHPVLIPRFGKPSGQAGKEKQPRLPSPALKKKHEIQRVQEFYCVGDRHRIEKGKCVS